MAKFHLSAQIVVIIVCLVPKFFCDSTEAPEAAGPSGIDKPVSKECMPTDYPFLVQMSVHCIGSLIERNIVLTTARCALDAKKVTSMSQTTTESRIERSKTHESYNTETRVGLNNIGLIKLTTPLNGGLVKVSGADAVKTCKPLKVAGTGAQCFVLTYLEGDSCTRPYQNNTKFDDVEFCGIPPPSGLIPSFTEYEGAPVICDNAILGLADDEFVGESAPYVKVHSYLQFIENAKKELMAPPGQPKKNPPSGPKNDSVAATQAGPVGGAASEQSPTAAPNNSVWVQSLNWNLFYAILTLLVNFL